jgi:hypothetical protein
MERRGAVDPALLFGISLVLSLALWWPSLTGALDGSIDITVAGLRYLAALGLSWIAVYGLSLLVSGYGREAHPAGPPALPPGTVEHPLRRSEDPALEAPATELVDDQPAAA